MRCLSFRKGQAMSYQRKQRRLQRRIQEMVAQAHADGRLHADWNVPQAFLTPAQASGASTGPDRPHPDIAGPTGWGRAPAEGRRAGGWRSGRFDATQPSTIANRELPLRPNFVLS